MVFTLGDNKWEDSNPTVKIGLGDTKTPANQILSNLPPSGVEPV